MCLTNFAAYEKTHVRITYQHPTSTLSQIFALGRNTLGTFRLVVKFSDKNVFAWNFFPLYSTNQSRVFTQLNDRLHDDRTKNSTSLDTCTYYDSNMACAPVTATYRKPFHLFSWNKPKYPQPKKKQVSDFHEKPKEPVRYNQATKLRDKVIKEYTIREAHPFIDYQALSHETVKTIAQEPLPRPKCTKTSSYRYKWIRDVPVVSSRFTEHVMMYHKPPFSSVRPTGRCGQFRLRWVQLEEPQKIIDKGENKPKVLLSGILRG